MKLFSYGPVTEYIHKQDAREADEMSLYRLKSLSIGSLFW
ncbi:unnamed protein product [Brassica rapa subsp. trilocularis]